VTDKKTLIFPPDESFIVLLENDLSEKSRADNPELESSPIFVETHADIATKANAIGLARRWENSGHGRTAIGRVTFSDLDQIRPVKTCGALLLPEDRNLDELIGKLHEIEGAELPIGDDANLAQMRLTILEWVRLL